MQSPHDALPLRPAAFHILLALTAGDLHGLGIGDEVERVSGGALTLGPGTLYRTLDEMRADGWIERAEGSGADEDPRRKHYRLTRVGRRVLEAEAARLDRLLAHARSRQVLPERA